MKAMNSVRKGKNKGNFKSYIVDPPNYCERPIDVPEESTERIEPLLLPEEVVVAEVDSVLRLVSVRAQILGSLFVTNFKLSFVTSSLPVDARELEVHRRCLHSDFLGLHDIGLTQIDAIGCLPEKKRLIPGVVPPAKVKGLRIILKNLRIVDFEFVCGRREAVTRLINALLVHRFPTKMDLFYLALPEPAPPSYTPTFNSYQDWEAELARTRCPNWRVSRHNEAHKSFPSLPESFVVPQCITDSDLVKAACNFQGNRPLTWCWGTPRGAALVRLAQLAPTISAVMSPDNQLTQMVHRSHTQKVQPTFFDLDQMVPSLKAIQASFLKLRDLHTPDSASATSDCEKTYLSRWQGSGWLAHVGRCLEVAQNTASAIALHNSSVILQEAEARDLSCVISSLVQLLLDPFARTIRGFSALVQKEWVALGHPFATRLGHLKPLSDEMCPLWLLFLDCVHQVARCHLAALEFTSEYLAALWQASHCSVHATFMFDSLKDAALTRKTLREETRSGEAFLWPVWAWWARGSGLRGGLQEGQLRAQRRYLEQRLSTVGVPPFVGVGRQSPQERQLRAEEQRLRQEEHTLKGAGLARRGARERFINILYVGELLRGAASPDSLPRLPDPLAGASAVWRRLAFLLGEGADSSLPYDPTVPPPPLELAPLRVPPGFAPRPWTECFGYWMRGAEPPPSGVGTRPLLEPDTGALDAHWVLARDAFALLSRLRTAQQTPSSNGLLSS